MHNETGKTVIMKTSKSSSNNAGVKLFDIDPHVGRTLDDVEKDLILATLTRCGGNRTWAADILGISVRTLRNKLNRYSCGQPRDPFLTDGENASGDEDAMTTRLQSYNPGNCLPS